MKKATNRHLERVARSALFALVAACLVLTAGSTFAAVEFLSSGGTQNANGGWSLPSGGYCGAGGISTAPTTRPECVATFFTASATSAACKPASPGIGGTWVTSATTTSFCIDLTNNSALTCVNVPPGGTYNGQTWPAGIQRVWNTNGAASACFLTYKGYDRNKVICYNQGGTYGTIQAIAPSLLTTNSGVCVGAWNFPLASTYVPPPITIAPGSQASSVGGDQCLRCHRSDTQWNVNSPRWVDSYLMTGHKNMARRVEPTSSSTLGSQLYVADQNGPTQAGFPWSGPAQAAAAAYTTMTTCTGAGFTWNSSDNTCIDAYPTDASGNAFNWATGQVTISGTPRQTYWIYDGWFEAAMLPTAIYSAAPTGSPLKPSVSYSCGRCHTTGWTSDATVNTFKTREPEASFSGITYSGTPPATNGQVNLAGGVAGDANPASSWDLFGISCNRCHGSAVDNSGSIPYSAAAGYSSHNNGFTGTSSASGNTDTGYCSLPNFQTIAACNPPAVGTTYTTAAACRNAGYIWDTNAKVCTGGTWLYTACSDRTSTTQVACVNAGKTWTYASCSTHNPGGVWSFAGTPAGIPQAYCSTPTTVYFTSAQCTAAGGTWTAGVCSVAPTTSPLCTAAPGGVWTAGNPVGFQCYLPNPSYITASSCAALTFNGGTLSPTWTNAFATDDDSCSDNGGGQWTDNRTNRGQIITSVCMGCHRQETSGLPNTNGTCTGFSATNQGACVAGGGTWADSGGGLPVTVGPYHSSVTFPSHMHGNQYANSPHGKYTGTFNALATAPFAFGGPNAWTSFFIGGTDYDLINQGGGCTTCHNVHKSTNELANPVLGGGAVKQCNDCHHKNLALMNHPSGPNTPLYDLADPVTACAKCHMPGGDHLFRININASYNTFPLPAAITANVSANTSPDGAYTNAVWTDLNASCGQCHGGNNWDGSVASQAATNVATTGSISSGSAVLTVASSAGFFPNEAIRVAGAYSYNGLVGGIATWADLNSFVKSVDSPTQITLAGTASHTVAGAAVMQDAPTGASWFPKSLLQTYATGIHNDAPTALFTASYGATGATIDVDGSLSLCSGSNANCNAYDWNWGDGTADGSGVTAAHTYAAAGSYTITLTVTQYGFDPGVATRVVHAYAADNPPTAAGACAFDYTQWTASCTNSSTDDHGIQLASINWGDGTVVTNITGLGPGPFVHTFLLPSNFTITLTAVDTSGQSSSAVIGTTTAGSFNFYSISGKAFKAGGVVPLSAAQIQVKKGVVLVKSMNTAADGSYSTGNMKPGTYTLTISKTGYTFASPTLTVTIPPTATSQNFTAN